MVSKKSRRIQKKTYLVPKRHETRRLGRIPAVRLETHVSSFGDERKKRVNQSPRRVSGSGDGKRKGKTRARDASRALVLMLLLVVVRGKDPLRLAFRAREGQVGGGQRDEHPPTRVSSEGGCGGGQRDEHPPTRVSSEGGCGGGIRTGSRLSVGIKKLVKKKKKEKEHTRARDATRLEPPVVVT